MMFVDSTRLTSLLDKHEEEFITRYSTYLNDLCQGDTQVYQTMATKDRVLLTVLSQFLKDHKKEVNLPIVDRISAAQTLLPHAKKTLKNHNKLNYS